MRGPISYIACLLQGDFAITPEINTQMSFFTASVFNKPFQYEIVTVCVLYLVLALQEFITLNY